MLDPGCFLSFFVFDFRFSIFVLSKIHFELLVHVKAAPMVG
jgi:hypothetical protein